ncbi:hypothetical protein AHMF7605_10955 [Adhaeribacter arboris]|uniref:STAS/SEC14 domain-containing protein n=1 Tax=Adhaeribacter arboris TaxID=2072846 RepID=A0A2T2YEQ7_9BACT|nr:hypothetical protein [Adhaeribacter arboris]PSR54001.1 hypothetical protein AHMF7605_10955 [Adhaeribacter arboris]
MILHQDLLLELIYDVKTDILSVQWPDIKDVSVSELEFSFQKLLDTVSHYDIKRLLIDSSKSVVTLDDKIYKPMLFRLVLAFNHTRLRKMARIISENELRENLLKSYAAEIKHKETLAFQTKEFNNQETALAWLCQD